MGKAATTFRVTREGWIWLAAAAGLWGTGAYKGMNLITLLASLLLAVWLLNVLLAGRRLPRLRCHWRVERPVFAGTPFGLEIEVEAPAGPAPVGVRLESQGPQHALAWFLTRLAGGDRVRLRQAVTLPQRGWYSWTALHLSSGYPHGLAERGVLVEPAGPTLVFPPLGRLHRGRLRRYLVQAAPSGGGACGRPCRLPAAQTEFHALRSFRPGDSPRWIHWRTSARRGELMVREFEDMPTDNLVLVLEPWLGDQGPGGRNPSLLPPEPRALAALEDAVSLAATICWDWCRQQGDRFVLAVAGRAPAVLGGVTGKDFGLVLLESLALVRGEATPDAGGLLERLDATPLPPAPVLLVSTRAGDLGDRLAGRLHRPVALVDVSVPGAYDFFERATPHAP